MSIWGFTWLLNINIKYLLHFRIEWIVKASRVHGFDPSLGFPRAGTGTALSRPFRHHFGPVQASPTICGSEADACLAWNYPRFVAFDRPFGDGLVQTANIAVSASTVHKYHKRSDLHVQGETTVISETFQTRRETRDGCFWPSREEEDSRALHKRRQTSRNKTRGVKWLEQAIGLVVSLGVRQRRGRETKSEAGIRAVELQPDFKPI